jgi:regulatory protein
VQSKADFYDCTNIFIKKMNIFLNIFQFPEKQLFLYTKKIKMDNEFQFFLSKAMKYCSIKECCLFELDKKFSDWQTPNQHYEPIKNYLLENNYINEQRYASAFVNDKIKFNHWGVNKVKYQLNAMNINSVYIQNALKQIDNDVYQNIIAHEAEKKIRNTKIIDEWTFKQKIYNYLTSKGFEIEFYIPIADNIINKVLRKNKP